MSTPGNNPQDPTADYRKYPKGPNFLLIVILASIVLVVLMVVAVVVVGKKGKSLEQHPPNPTPNSLVQPLLPNLVTTRLT
jgi:hypothetical protein